MSEVESSPLDDLLKQSTIVFKGTIKHAHNNGRVPANTSADTSVVHVDAVYYSRGTGPNLEGQDVAVKGKDVSDDDVGKTQVFFAKSWLYGQSVALIEVARAPEGSESATKDEIQEALDRLAANRILYRIALANVIVTGKVSEIIAATDLSEIPPTSREGLHFAVIQVDSVEKGQYSLKTIKVLFSSSFEPRWRMPRFHKGQEGIWLLQRNQTERKGPLNGIPAFTALDSDDFHPKDEVEAIRAMIRRSW